MQSWLKILATTAINSKTTLTSICLLSVSRFPESEITNMVYKYQLKSSKSFNEVAISEKQQQLLICVLSYGSNSMMDPRCFLLSLYHFFDHKTLDVIEGFICWIQWTKTIFQQFTAHSLGLVSNLNIFMHETALNVHKHKTSVQVKLQRSVSRAGTGSGRPDRFRASLKLNWLLGRFLSKLDWARALK